jgi:hypothetical protein
MSLVHPLEAQPYGWPGWDLSPTKRRRLSTHSWAYPARQIDTEERHSVPKDASTRLDTLPVEILAIILDYSLEASLIHTSRRMWCSLPAYVHYTKTLALKALVRLEDWPAYPASVSEHWPDIVRLHRSLDPGIQRHLREIVFSSGWFGEQHLNQAHRTLLIGRSPIVVHGMETMLLPNINAKKLNPSSNVNPHLRPQLSCTCVFLAEEGGPGTSRRNNFVSLSPVRLSSDLCLSTFSILATPSQTIFCEFPSQLPKRPSFETCASQSGFLEKRTTFPAIERCCIK